MKIVNNSFLPFGGDYAAINLFGVLFVRRGMRITAELVNHERIHTAQMRELLFVPFYIIYVCEWIFKLFRAKGNFQQAYMSISFEREAYARGNDLSYLAHRRPFAQWRKPRS